MKHGYCVTFRYAILRHILFIDLKKIEKKMEEKTPNYLFCIITDLEELSTGHIYGGMQL